MAHNIYNAGKRKNEISGSRAFKPVFEEEKNKKFKNICPKPKMQEQFLIHFTKRKYEIVGVFKIYILKLVDELDALEKCQFLADNIEPNCLCFCTTLYSVMQSDLAEMSSWTALTGQLEMKTASYAKYITSKYVRNFMIKILVSHNISRKCVPKKE